MIVKSLLCLILFRACIENWEYVYGILIECFFCITSIEGEYCPCAGDEVTYRVCPIPPKIEKLQAIHVKIVHFTPDVNKLLLILVARTFAILTNWAFLFVTGSQEMG